MIIECTNCHKKFKVKSSLIPESGRDIQCGSCNHIWFYKEKVNILSDPLKIDNQNFTDEEKNQENNEIINETKIEKNIKSNTNTFNFNTILSYLIANAFVENSNFNSVKVSVELSHPIKGLIPGLSVMYSIIHLSYVLVPDCMAVLEGLYIFAFFIMVGAAGFEPATLWSQTRCATRLRYAPNEILIQYIM